MKIKSFCTERCAGGSPDVNGRINTLLLFYFYFYFSVFFSKALRNQFLLIPWFCILLFFRFHERSFPFQKPTSHLPSALPLAKRDRFGIGSFLFQMSLRFCRRIMVGRTVQANNLDGILQHFSAEDGWQSACGVDRWKWGMSFWTRR